MAENEYTDFRRVVVLGAGAMGSFYGALLSKSIDVLLIGRGEHVNAVNSRGLIVSGAIEGRFLIRASTHLTEVSKDTLILLTTKAQDSEKAIRGIRSLLNPYTVILVLQNGLEMKIW